MADKVQYKADYLKVTGADDAHDVKNITDILRAHSEIINQADRSEKIDPIVFGFFHEQLRSYKWVVLRFDPYSVDCRIQKKNTLYETRDQALNAAVQYLSDNGYQAKPFDLELMIDKI